MIIKGLCKLSYICRETTFMKCPLIGYYTQKRNCICDILLLVCDKFKTDILENKSDFDFVQNKDSKKERLSSVHRSSSVTQILLHYSLLNSLSSASPLEKVTIIDPFNLNLTFTLTTLLTQQFHLSYPFSPPRPPRPARRCWRFSSFCRPACVWVAAAPPCPAPCAPV